MSNNNYGKVAASGMVWQLTERIFTAFLQFVLTTILARLLQPEEYGIIAIVMVFITISDLLVIAGLGTAIIQGKNIDQVALSSVFYFNIVASVIFYVILFFCAPLIADFYKAPIVSPILRCYSIVILPTAINNMLRSMLLKELQYKKVFLSSIIPLFISGVVGVIAAYLGAGVFAMAIQALVYAFFAMVILFFVTKWKPGLCFSWEKSLNLLKYGWKLLVANLIEVGYKNIYPLIIPRFFSKSALGFYTYGRQIPNVVVSTVNSSTIGTMFPIFSKCQDDKKMLKEYLRRTIRISNFIIFPIMAGISVLSKEIIIILLGQKWADSAFYLSLFCIIYGLFHVQNINFQAISATGRSEVFLKYETIKKIAGVTSIAIAIPLGIKALIWGQVILAVIYILLSIWPNIKYLNYSFKEQICDFVPTFIISILMFFIVFVLLAVFKNANIYIVSVAGVITGVTVYIGLCRLLKIKEMKEALSFIKQYFKK